MKTRKDYLVELAAAALCGEPGCGGWTAADRAINALREIENRFASEPAQEAPASCPDCDDVPWRKKACPYCADAPARSALDALAELERKATQGPWTNDKQNRGAPCCSIHTLGVPFVGAVMQTSNLNGSSQVAGQWASNARQDERIANSDLIVSVRNALPDLIRLARIGIAAEQAKERGA